MTTLHGEILPYLDAIGTDDGSAAMIAAMKKVGTTFQLQEYTSSGVHEKYLVFKKGGVDFLVLDGIVDTIFFRLIEDADGAPHPRPGALIEGLEQGMSADDVPAVLGAPHRAKPRYLKYEVDGKYLNISIRDDRVEDFCVQRTDFGADDPGADPEMREPVPSRPITGEISQFINAVGVAEGDRALTDVIQAVGPQFTSHEIDDDKGARTFLVFPESGVDVQLGDGHVVGVLLHTTEEERSAYPRLEALVDGLALPATRAGVTAALGTAQTSLENLDLYTEQGRYVMFNYTGDLLTTISIVHVPEGDRR